MGESSRRMMRFLTCCSIGVRTSSQVVCAGLLTPPEWREQDERATADLKATGTVKPYEKEFVRKDGTRIAVLTGGALFDLQGTDGVAFAFDLSRQKQAEAEIRALKDQLYRENLALRDEVERALMFEEIVGYSKPLKTVLSRIAKVA